MYIIGNIVATLIDIQFDRQEPLAMPDGCLLFDSYLLVITIGQHVWPDPRWNPCDKAVS